MRPAAKPRNHSNPSRIQILLLSSSVLFGVACSSWSGSQDLPSPAEKAAIAEETEDALAAIRSMTSFLNAQPTLRFVSEIQYDAVQRSGEKIEFGSRREVSFVRPDRYRGEVVLWDGSQQIVTFDGERVSAALPEEGVYATSPFAGEAGDAFDYLNAELGIASPLIDLVRLDLADEISDRILSGLRVGTVTIAGITCDHFAFQAKHLDFQLFIRQGEEPVPVRLVIDYHSEEGRPQFRAMMSDWKLAAQLPEDLFRFLPPAGSQRVSFPELIDMLLGPVEIDAAEGVDR